jgi:hypothetical protein
MGLEETVSECSDKSREGCKTCQGKAEICERVGKAFDDPCRFAPSANAACRGEYGDLGDWRCDCGADDPSECRTPPSSTRDIDTIRRLHGLIEQLAGRFKGYLPWPEEKRDTVVRGHEMFIEDTIRKADALASAAPVSATRWISVRDRLPEAHNHRVGHLAYNAGGVFFTTVHPSWWNSIDPRGPDYNGPSVTHWMEIPGAPVDRNADR